MSLEVKVAEVKTVIDQTLGPDGSVTLILSEIKEQLREGTKVMQQHDLRIDRLEQKQKNRTKLFWAATSAWVSVAAAWVWDHVAHR